MKYQGVVWTNHALQRLSEREIKIDDALLTLNSPQESRYATSKNAWVFYRTWGKDKIEVVAKQNEKGEWVVLSVWSKRVSGSRQSESWWQYFWRQIVGR